MSSIPGAGPDPSPEAVNPYASLGAVELDDLLSQLGGLLGELVDRAASASGAHGRLAALLDAVLAVSSDLELADVLSRITRAACSLTGARYGALGVLGPTGNRLVEFITDGMTMAEREAIGQLPEGHGILGLLIEDPKPRRIKDIGADSHSFGFPPNHPEMHSFLGAPIRIRDEVFGNLYLAEKRGADEFDETDESTVVALAAAASVAIDNARLYDNSRRRAVGSAAVGDLTRSLLEGHDEAAALAEFAHGLAGLAEATVAGVILRDRVGRRRLVARSDRVSAASTPGEPALYETSTPIAPWPADAPPDIWGALEASRHPLLLEASPSAGSVSPPALAVGRVLGIEDPSAVAVLNLSSGDTDLGLVVLAWDAGVGEPMLDVGELGELAQHAGVALLAARARAAQSQMALLSDRERIARDMHDHVIQRLFATGLSLQAAGQATPDPLLQSRLDTAVDDLDASIREIRMTIFELSQFRTGLTTTEQLSQILAAFARGLGFAPHLEVEGDLGSLADVLRDEITAVVREGLSNVMRHAHATRVDVTVRLAEDVTVEIVDDGIGTPPSLARGGLLNLGERARERDGSFEVLPARPNGSGGSTRAVDSNGSEGTHGSGGTLLRWRVPNPSSSRTHR